MQIYAEGNHGRQARAIQQNVTQMFIFGKKRKEKEKQLTIECDDT